MWARPRSRCRRRRRAARTRGAHARARDASRERAAADAAVPAGTRPRCSGSAASGAPRRRSGSRRRRHDRRRLRGRPHAESDVRGGVHGRTGHNEVVLVVFDPKAVSYETLLKVFWRATIPRRACARATTSARSTLRHLRGLAEQRKAARLARRLPARAERGRHGHITTEILDAPEFYYAEAITSSTSARTPGATAATAVPASPAQRGSPRPRVSPRGPRRPMSVPRRATGPRRSPPTRARSAAARRRDRVSPRHETKWRRDFAWRRTLYRRGRRAGQRRAGPVRPRAGEWPRRARGPSRRGVGRHRARGDVVQHRQELSGGAAGVAVGAASSKASTIASATRRVTPTSTPSRIARSPGATSCSRRASGRARCSASPIRSTTTVTSTRPTSARPTRACRAGCGRRARSGSTTTSA